MTVIQLVSIILNFISAIAALAVIVIFFILKKYSRASVERVSLRLQLGIAFLDVFSHVMNIFSFGQNKLLCESIGFLTMLFAHMYLGINIAIAMNLNLAILCNLKPTKKWEKIYWIISIIVPFIFNVPVLAAGLFGKNSAGKCLFKDGPSASSSLQIIYNTVFSTVTIVYCLFVSLMVIYKIKTEEYHKPGTSSFIPSTCTRASLVLDLRSLICRICLYPITCFLTCIGSNIVITYHFLFNTYPTVLLYWGRLGVFSRGLLHLAAFLGDPGIFKSLCGLFNNNQDQKETLGLPHTNFICASTICDFSYEALMKPSTIEESFIFDTNVEIFKQFI